MMNEQLQQALAELVNMIKGGLSQLPPFLKQLTTELAQYQFASGVVWASVWLISSVVLGVSILWLIKKQLRDKNDDGIFGGFSVILSLVFILTLTLTAINITSALRAKYAPTSVLIEYVTGKGGCGK